MGLTPSDAAALSKSSMWLFGIKMNVQQSEYAGKDANHQSQVNNNLQQRSPKCLGLYELLLVVVITQTFV
eukprot:2952719-Amphidinium_carterae.1